MSKKRKGGLFSRLIWTIFILGFVAIGAVLFLSTLPTIGILINYNVEQNIIVTTLVYSCSLALKGFGVLFGGELDKSEFHATLVAGDQEIGTGQFEAPNLGTTYNFNYVVFIGIILVLIGVLLAIIFFRKKTISLVACLFLIAGAILLCLDSIFFQMINSEVLNLPQDLEGLQIIDVPSLLFGIFSALSGITVLFHTLTIKK